jgi:ketosteroid isomerase-like protein
MSRENVDMARRGIDAFNRRDLAEFAEIITADYEWVGAFLGAVEGGSYRGLQGLRRYFLEAVETWEEFSVSGEDFRDLGDMVLIVGRMRGRGRNSKVELDTEYTMIAEFREGRIARSRSYLDHDEALRAAGLGSDRVTRR